MLSYPFLNDLFKAVLGKSKAIGGRFHISAKGGTEINMDTVGELVDDLVSKPETKKIPFVIMLPPRSIGDYSSTEGWDEYNVTMFFLKSTFYNSNNQVSAVNPNTRTSTHTIPQDWHDMKRCAVGFTRALDRSQRKGGLILNRFRMVSKTLKVITPVSMVGQDRLSGVMLDFKCQVFVGCDIEDYEVEDIDSITLPTGDSHPEHNL